MRNKELQQKLDSASFSAETVVVQNDRSMAAYNKRRIGAVLLFVVAILLCIELSMTQSVSKLSGVVFRYSQTAQGTVTELKLDYVSTGRRSRYTTPNEYYKPIVEFDYNGKHYKTECDNESKTKDKLQSVGESVQLRFDPDDPYNAYISKGGSKDTARLVLLITGLALNTLCMILLIIKAVRCFRPYSNGRLICTSGKIPAPVLTVLTMVDIAVSVLASFY